MNSLTPERLIMDADAVNIRLEIVRGVPMWEATPGLGHQLQVDRIRASIQPSTDTNCGCVHVADVLFKFPDGSYKRPDIAILCALPENPDQNSAVDAIPEAVVEIISEGYEHKDLEIAPSFYLSIGVKDVIVFDPQLKIVYHHRRDAKKRLESPVVIELECGCRCEV